MSTENGGEHFVSPQDVNKCVVASPLVLTPGNPFQSAAGRPHSEWFHFVYAVF